EIGGQPPPLRTARVAPTGVGAVRVERDEVPRADVVAVEALAGRAGGGAEVAEVTGRSGVGRIAARAARREVLVVARRRPGDRLGAAPRLVVGGVVGRAAPAVVLVVAQGQYGGGSLAQDEVRRGQLTAVRAEPLAVLEVGVGGITGDVAGCHDDGIGPRGRRCRRRGRRRGGGRSRGGG